MVKIDHFGLFTIELLLFMDFFDVKSKYFMIFVS